MKTPITRQKGFDEKKINIAKENTEVNKPLKKRKCTKSDYNYIIKKGQQCKAQRVISGDSKDPSPTKPTYKQKEEKGKKNRIL